MAERAATLARRLVDREDALEAATAAAKAAKEAYDQAETEFWDRMDDEGDTTRTLDLGKGYGKVQFIRRETPRAVVRSKERAIKWCQENDLAEAFLEPLSVRQKPMTDELKQRLANEEPFPDGVDVSFTRYVTITRKPN